VPRDRHACLKACDTILTPFSLSPLMDMAVDSLPGLFLTYCTITDLDDVLSIDDRTVPQASDSVASL
jgi:hypothetical protein